MTIRCVEDHDARTLAVHACAEDGPAGQLVGVAVQKPPRGPLLSDLPVPAAHALAAHLAGTTGVSSVRGLEAASAAVAGHYAALAGVADRELILDWLTAFPAVDREAVERRFAHGGLMWCWEVGGEPVSFAWRSPLRGRGRWPRISVVGVSAVYTPPDGVDTDMRARTWRR